MRDPTKHRFEDAIEGPIQSDAEAGFGLFARATCPTAFGQNQSLNMPVQFRVVASEVMPLRGGRSSLSATLDSPYSVLANAVSSLPMPRLRPHREAARLRVELILPDGSTLQQFASVAAVTPINAPGVITFAGLADTEIPPGTSVELLRFEAQPR